MACTFTRNSKLNRKIINCSNERYIKQEAGFCRLEENISEKAGQLLKTKYTLFPRKIYHNCRAMFSEYLLLTIIKWCKCI